IDPEKVRVRVPHLLIWGLNDMALRRQAFEGLEEFCDDLTIRTFDDADHWILHQKPDECAALIREFVG
ncbi:MAG: alpha/beta hydrolase, partial [Pseudomonadota bacterium]